MSTTFFLVRHAAHDRLDRILCGRIPGVELGHDGLGQAEEVAARLGPKGLAGVYSSPLERARMTAEAIASRAGTGVRVLEAVNEIDFGEWSGRAFDDLHGDPRWATWNSARHVARPPGGESMREAQARALDGIEVLRTEHRAASVAVVSHSDVIKAILAYFLGIPLDGLQRFEIAPASVSTLVLGDWGAKVLAMNAAAGP